MKGLPSSESFTDGDLLRPIFWKPHLLIPSNGRFRYMMDMMDDDGRMSEKRERGPREKRKSLEKVAGEGVLTNKNYGVGMTSSPRTRLQPSATTEPVPVLASSGIVGSPAVSK